MNKIANYFLLAGHKFIPEMYFKPVFNVCSYHSHTLADHLQKARKEFKNLKKQEIIGTFIKTN